MIVAILAQAAPIFVRPLPVWNIWWLLLAPLCAAIAIVYKSIKCHQMRDVPREAATITFWILLGMAVAAVALLVLVNLVAG